MHTNNTDDTRLASAFRGETIYGDDFNRDEIDQWFLDEVNGYSKLDHLASQTTYYAYRAMDEAYAWPHLDRTEMDVLGLGSSFGSEFAAIANRISRLTIIEPGEVFWRSTVAGINARYMRPSPDGAIDLPSNSFDLVTAFSVLHHIPNVSYVFSELIRVLRPGGRLIVREPVVSMGDWRLPRRGLTARERGIPLQAMMALISSHQCSVVRARLIGFAPLQKLASMFGSSSLWNSAAGLRIDALLSRAFARNYRYHRTTFLNRFAPATGHWVITKLPHSASE